MKKTKKYIGFLLACILFLTGCGASSDGGAKDDKTPSDTTLNDKEDTAVKEPTPDKKPVLSDLRVLISSDVHCTDLLEWYGVDYSDRMQHWVDSVLKEHAENPFDLIVINGDISLDYWINGGSVLGKGEGTAGIFVNEYLTQLPDDLPVYIMAGNHEQYSDERWLALTGNHRQGAMVVGGRLFLMLDNFSGKLDPDYHHDGEYTLTDVAYIEEMMAQYPEHDVYLIAHYFDTAKESAAFKKLVAENDRIKGLFAGHTHKSGIVETDASWGNKPIAQTGNFAYFKDSAKESFWGFRELVITEENAYSQYIIVESVATVDGVSKKFDRTVLNQVCYYGTAPALPSQNDPLEKYTLLYDKIIEGSIKGDEGMKKTNRVQLIFDNQVNTKWCVRPTSADGSVTVEWQMTKAVQIDAYAISTANDWPDRNPDAWTLYGKNDPDGEWTVLSSISGGNLPKELFTMSDIFTIENPGTYQYYKLTVTENFNNRDLYQFSELILLQKK
ncbi:MAG: hypothetical protein E7616_08655 [Ruminococcaceae bacterium]|nr:hypothetical protein [Oscillospiraceae bacterium]